MLVRMPHLHRFHIAPETPGTGPITLTPDEAHHASRVVRVREGDEVALFDGQGRELLGTVAVCNKKDVVVEVTSERSEAPPTPVLTLAQAGLHRDKPMEFVIRHGTELGVRHFVFYRAERSERPPKFSEKWTKLAVECCKQCGRLWLPTFEIAESLEDLLEETPGRVLIATGERPPVPWSEAVNAQAITLVVGAEGDFTDAELAAAADAGAHPVSLGPTVYRAEVASIIGCTIIAHETGQLGPRV